jgi:hypothetical protein
MNSAPATSVAQVPDPLFQFAAITAIRPDLSQPPMLIVLEWCKQLPGSLSILRVGWLNLDFQYQTERIYE